MAHSHAARKGRLTIALLPQDRSPFRKPDNVLVVRRGHIKRHVVKLHRLDRARVTPFSDFGVSVSEGNTSGPVVITGRVINDPGRGGVLHHHVGETTGVDAVRVLVQKYVELG